MRLCLHATCLNETTPNIQYFQLAVAKLWRSVNANELCSSKAELETENTEYSCPKTILRISYLLHTAYSTRTSKQEISTNHIIIQRDECSKCYICYGCKRKGVRTV